MHRQLLILQSLSATCALVALAAPSYGNQEDVAHWRVQQSYPRPNTEFSVDLRETSDQGYISATKVVSVSLTPALDSAFRDAQVHPDLTNELNLTSTSLGGGNYLLTITPSPDSSYESVSDEHSLAQIHFWGISNGAEETLTINSVEYFDATGDALPISSASSTSRIDVADIKIYTTGSLEYTSGTYSRVGLSAPHPEGPISWSITSGALPSGMFLRQSSITGIPNTSGQQGSFTVTAKSGSGLTASMAVPYIVEAARPQLRSVSYTDANSDLAVSQGDTLEFLFSQDISFSANWSNSIAPIQSTDSFGSGASLSHSSNPKRIILTLGQNPILSDLGVVGATQIGLVGPELFGSTGLSALSDEEGIGTAFAPGLGDIFDDLSVGNPIPSVTLAAPPFPTTYHIDGLPPGLHITGGNGAPLILNGTPTSTGSGQAAFTRLAADGSPTFARSSKFWVVRDEPIPSFGVFDLEGNPLEPGELISLKISTNDSITPPEAYIGGIQLIPVDRSDANLPTFVLPDNAVSGDLVVGQGSSVYDAGWVTVSLPSSTTDVTLIERWTYVPPANPQAPSASEKLYIHGSGFLPSPSITVGGVQATILESGDDFIVAVVPVAAQDGQAPPASTDVTVDDGAGNSETEDGETSNSCPPNVDTENDDNKERFDELCALINAAGDYIGNGHSCKGISEINWRWLMKYHAIHESRGLDKRVQVGGGPGRGLGQMEPETFADVWERANRLQRDTVAYILLVMGKLSAEEIAAIDDEVDEIEDSGENVWPEGGVAEGTITHNDLFFFMISRIHYRRDLDKAGGPGPPVGAPMPPWATPPIGTPTGGPGGGPGGAPGGIVPPSTPDKCLAFEDWKNNWHRSAANAGSITQAKLKSMYLESLCGFLDDAFEVPEFEPGEVDTDPVRFTRQQ